MSATCQYRGLTRYFAVQATFLRGPAAGAEENAELAAELEALPDEELETRCRRSGLSKRGGRAAQISR